MLAPYPKCDWRMVNGEIYNTYLQMSAVIKAQAQLIFLANIGLQTFM